MKPIDEITRVLIMTFAATVGGCVALFMVFFTGFILYKVVDDTFIDGYKWLRLSTHGIETEAEVIAVWIDYHPRGGTSTVTYQFDIPNDPEPIVITEKLSTYEARRLDVGSKIVIVYDPEIVNWAGIRGNYRFTTFPCLTLMGVTYFLVRKLKRRKQRKYAA